MVKYVRGSVKMPMMELLLRDGVLYFVMIFAVNLLNTLLYWLAPEDLKALGASFSQIITSIMIARLQLNLRQKHEMYTDRDLAYPSSGQGQKWSKQNLGKSTAVSSFIDNMEAKSTFFTVGNLGEELESWSGEKDTYVEQDIPLRGFHDIPPRSFA